MVPVMAGSANLEHTLTLARCRRRPSGQISQPPGGQNDVTAGALVGEHGRMPMQFDPPSGTRDFLAADVEARERAFTIIRSVFSRYGFEPLQTPAFERLDVLLGKYGEEGDKLIFKILRRGEHEASGEADLALRYDLTVPLPTAASCPRRTSGTRSGPSGARTGQARAATASSSSATSTPSARHRPWPTPR